MDRLKDKVAIITGSGVGMGHAAAILFAKEGAKVAVTDINEESGMETVNQINESGGEAYFWKMDVSKEPDCKKVVDEVVKKWGKLDILVNNAGVTGSNNPTHELTEADWDFVLNVDVKGCFFMTKYAIPYMKANGKGSIVNISSIGGLVATAGIPPYHAAKGALTMMTKIDAITYGPDHIRVNSIHPGLILTPLTLKGEELVPGNIANMTKKIPLGYAGECEDVANAMLFLASDEARFVTGAQIVVDGGYTAQ